MQPGADFLGRGLAAAAPAAAGFLRDGIGQKCRHHNPSAEGLEKSTPVKGEIVGRTGQQFVAFGFKGRHAVTFTFAAIRTAATMRGYVPQRQMLPCMNCRISASSGSGRFLSNATADMIIPDVQ